MQGSNSELDISEDVPLAFFDAAQVPEGEQENSQTLQNFSSIEN